MDGNIIDEAVKYIRALFRGNADGHGADHTLRVYRTAMLLADSRPECDAGVVALAALLHDADDHKLFSTENFANARAFLEGQGVDGETEERICRVIDQVSFSQNRGRRPDTVEAMIVQDADRLDAMGALGIARTFAYGGKNGRPLDQSVQHFYDKLLLLKDGMNTDEAKALADARHRFLLDFLEELREETGGII